MTDVRDAIAKLRALHEQPRRHEDCGLIYRPAAGVCDCEMSHVWLERDHLDALLAVAEAADRLSAWQIPDCPPHERDRVRLLDALAELAKVAP